MSRGPNQRGWGCVTCLVLYARKPCTLSGLWAGVEHVDDRIRQTRSPLYPLEVRPVTRRRCHRRGTACVSSFFCSNRVGLVGDANSQVRGDGRVALAVPATSFCRQICCLPLPWPRPEVWMGNSWRPLYLLEEMLWQSGWGHRRGKSAYHNCRARLIIRPLRVSPSGRPLSPLGRTSICDGRQESWRAWLCPAAYGGRRWTLQSPPRRGRGEARGKTRGHTPVALRS